jgi:histidyl-tRNA synthetase
VQRLDAGQIDLDDLTPTRRSSDKFYLTRTQSECRRDGMLDGGIRLSVDGSSPHPDAQLSLVQALYPFGPRTRVGYHVEAQHWPYHVKSTMPATQFQAPRGTQDILPEDAPYWAFVEDEMRRQARLANYSEIRTPTFEDTGVFQRGVGATTDIVEKEMYTFLDKGGDSMTLRPEGTAGIVRAYLQRGMASRPQPVKLFTELTTFRYDKPQKGRFREFHQIDFEVIGDADPLVDAELVALQWRLYAELGLRNLSLQVNSIGDQACRPAYIQKLADYFRQHLDGLCEDCQRRLKTNPLRLLDEKKPECQAVLEGAPRSADNLCAECRTHFDAWLGYLEGAGIPFTINPRLVRGLDYYTRSVWEVWPPVVGTQSALGGGGRYDRLAEELGGRPTPGVGFASGMERIILELKNQDVAIPPIADLCAFVVYRNEGGKRLAFRLAETLRANGVSADLSFGDRALRKQFGAADRAGAHYAIVVDEDVLASDWVDVKDLRNDGDQRRVAVRDLVAVLRGERAATE